MKQPFIDWANSLDDGPTARLDTYESTLMLVDEMEDAAEWPELERWLWERIFAHQLAGWHRDPRDWPQPRTLTMFREWFDVALHLGVHDASDDPMLEY